MQLGKTGFIQLRLSPEFYSWLWVVLFGPILQNIASKSEKTVFDGNRPKLSQWEAELSNARRSSTGSVTYLTTCGSVVFLLCLQ